MIKETEKYFWKRHKCENRKVNFPIGLFNDKKAKGKMRLLRGRTLCREENASKTTRILIPYHYFG